MGSNVDLIAIVLIIENRVSVNLNAYLLGHSRRKLKIFVLLTNNEIFRFGIGKANLQKILPLILNIDNMRLDLPFIKGNILCIN